MYYWKSFSSLILFPHLLLHRHLLEVGIAECLLVDSLYLVFWLCDSDIRALCGVVAESVVVHAFEQGIPLQEHLYRVYAGHILLDVCRDYHAQ